MPRSLVRRRVSTSCPRQRGNALALALVLVSGLPAWAQSPAPQVQAQPQNNTQQPQGTVSGRITCSDTQRPARFAQVSLIPVEDLTDNEAGPRQGRRGSARTDLDGNFTTLLAPGDYVVAASATGYVSPLALVQQQVAAGVAVADAIRGLPVVHVSAGGIATTSASMDRGSVISGRVTWDDGTPASGVNIVAVNAQTTPQTGPGNGGGRNGLLGFFSSSSYGLTDDRGMFRLMELPPGQYVLRANLIAPASAVPGQVFQRTTSVALYAPGKLRRSEAQVITLHAGEERPDVVFTLDLHALHTVSGRVNSTSDSVNVASGTIRITDTQDSSLVRMAQIGTDGSFSLPYVPAGTYTLSVPFASSTAATIGRRGPGRGGNGGGTPAGTSFQPLQTSVTVGDTDVSGLNLTVVPQVAANGTAAP